MSTQSDQPRKLSVTDAYTMAVGGMIGGGIFSVLGVVVAIAGHLAAAAFLIAGVLAFLTGLAYAGLYERHGAAGGAVAFVRTATGSATLAGHLGWALILGYVFTDSLYAFTFGHYLANVFRAPAWVAPAAALAITLLVLGVNMLGVSQAGWVEQITVWGKLAILGGLVAFGLWRFDARRLLPPPDDALMAPFVAAAMVFIAFEGFQLLAYDVDEMDDPRQNLRRAMLPAIATATLIYIAVAVAAFMLVSERELIAQGEVALALAGQAALGTAGLWLLTVAALFSTASAINATLFATARLAALVARDDQLPGWFAQMSTEGVPRRALLVIGAAGAAFAMLGSIERIVTFASLTFLGVFAVVNTIQAREAEGRVVRLVAGATAGALVLALVAVIVWLSTHRLPSLLVAGGVALTLVATRWWFLRRAATEP